MDDALKRKMATEFGSISETTFWFEFLKAIRGYGSYSSRTLEKSNVDWDIARAQGVIQAIEKVFRIPHELTGIETGLDKIPEK